MTETSAEKPGRRASIRRAAVLFVVLLTASAAGIGAVPAEGCVSGCSTDTPTPTPDPGTNTPTPTPTPSDTPTSSATPTPTGTPTPTDTPTPSGTPTPPPATSPGDGSTSPPDTDTATPTPSIDGDSTLAAVDGSGISDAAMQSLQTAIDKAQAAVDAAQSVLDSATSEYDATKTAYANAKNLATSADAIAKSAESAAKAAVAKLMVALQQTHADQATTTIGAIFGDEAAGGDADLLQRLTAANQLGSMHGPLDTLTKRAESTAKRADAMKAAAAKADAALAAIPLTQKRAAEKAAQSAVDAAQASLDAATGAMITASSNGADSGFTDDFTLAPGSWVDPVKGPITDVFGPRPSQPAGTPVFHPGVDIGAGCMSVIVAAADGTVSYAGPYSGYGNFILIDHGDGVQTAYGHISDGTIMVAPGDQVTAGQPIARVGSTGESTGCHLHIEVRVNGNAIDPTPFFLNRGVVLGSS
ncbi:peptidoglycan DD-metalloendopeptidase family protein [Humibacter sp.]|uniref:M23 family metallopeptidase n=1 Tax=Humibacter sp. TaxID=1940291 RepID=UPI003F81AB5D